MSVINQMLRDLDARQTQAATTGPTAPPAQAGAAAAAGRRWPLRTRLLAAATLATLAYAASQWWLPPSGWPGTPEPPTAVVTRTEVAAAASVPPQAGASATPAGANARASVPARPKPDAVPAGTSASAPVAAAVQATDRSAAALPATRALPSALPTASVTKAAAPPAMAVAADPKRAAVASAPAAPPRTANRPAPAVPLAVSEALQLRLSARLTLPALPAALPSAADVGRVATRPPQTVGLQPDLPQSAAAASAAQPGAALLLQGAAPTAAPSAPARHAGELVAQARNLWANGAREEALTLLRDGLAQVESARSPDAAAQVQLLRELASLELAQGQSQRVLELLSRSEPALAQQADLWALRGNAQQRLGQYRASAQAYLQALKLQPGEARWLLAAAVSLAADGQLGLAGDLADQARARGPLNPEVLNYLRQSGVLLRQP